MTGEPWLLAVLGSAGDEAGPQWDGCSKLGMKTLPPSSAEGYTQSEPLSGTASRQREAITTGLPESKIYPQLVLNHFVLGFKIC